MKITTDALVRFIEDFRLERQKDVLCFDAVVVYTTLKKQIQLPSEIHIIHLSHTGLDVVYLLDPDVIKHGIPDKIEDVSTIEYRQNEFLYIKGSNSADGNYILSIHPTGSKCEPNVLKELHQKTYN